MGVPPVKNGPHPFLFFDDRPKAVLYGRNAILQWKSYALLPNREWNQRQKHKKQPWSKVEGPRKRVAEGLCGWRHGNSFPMTQSTQSHRQMRSIPRCTKAVFYVFVFDSIHDSATMHNFSTEESHSYHTKQIWGGRQKKKWV